MMPTISHYQALLASSASICQIVGEPTIGICQIVNPPIALPNTPVQCMPGHRGTSKSCCRCIGHGKFAPIRCPGPAGGAKPCAPRLPMAAPNGGGGVWGGCPVHWAAPGGAFAAHSPPAVAPPPCCSQAAPPLRPHPEAVFCNGGGCTAPPAGGAPHPP